MIEVVNQDAVDGMVRRFKEAWHKADQEGKEGSRVEAGILAALEPVWAALDEVHYRWHLLAHSRNILDQSDALLQVSNTLHDLTTWHPGYEYNSGTLPWERDTDGE